ncbi:DUF2939 domain-containing protein [Bradyrhizobium sp. CW9]|uniref:DUF2939 domain-containing protein n=1 Tax=Bradyrhizobium sp. CW9 TaxID=2782689 RepID=UPI001FF88A10|nr:DUF2939 domain-containing protein [Bradyrhizobium sp. CW9]MCK1328630.1 DUF2939 domain-containing protein [Bradyrhizobium sp. CW9]
MDWLIPIIFCAVIALIAFAHFERKTAISLSLFSFVLFWMAWPYHVAYNLAVAMKDGNASGIESRIDWEHLRQGLRGDLNAMVLQNVSRTGSSSSASGLVAALAPAIINQMIDGYITPQGIANLVGQRKQAKAGDATTGDGNRGGFDLSRVQYAFFDGGPFTFNVQLTNEKPNEEPFVILFRWDGSWRLSRLVLPKSAFANTLDRRSPPSSPAVASNRIVGSAPAASTRASSPPTPSPFKVSLTRKGFKNSDPTNRDYEDDITFSVAIENTGQRNIRAFDGTLTFTDLLDNEIHSSVLAINEPVGGGATLVWNGRLKYNQFIDAHQRLRSASFENLKIKFIPRKLLFADGSMEQLNR